MQPAQQFWYAFVIIAQDADWTSATVQAINVGPQLISVSPQAVNVQPQGINISPSLIVIGPYDTSVSAQVSHCAACAFIFSPEGNRLLHPGNDGADGHAALYKLQHGCTDGMCCNQKACML